MPIARTARIHPSAIVDPLADIAPDVVVGPHAIIEAEAQIGGGCKVGAGVHIIGHVVLGEENEIFSHAVLGERPQHTKYKGEPTRLEIGNRNIIRENVTIHRGTVVSGVTRIGDNNFLMAGCHVAHDCVIANDCIIANGALLAGHCELGNNVLLSGNCVIHQFARIGRLGMLSGTTATIKDVPPFIMVQAFCLVRGVNVVGMRRAGIPTERIDAVRQAFQILYHRNLTVPQAIERIEKTLPGVPEVAEMVTFINASPRGISLHTVRDNAAAA